MSNEKKLISSYQAEDAINDGVLIKIAEVTTREIGFQCPVRISNGVYQLVKPSPEAVIQGQTYEARLRDVLNAALIAIWLKPERITNFKVFFWNRPDYQFQKWLWATPDETSGPAIHILLPEEY